MILETILISLIASAAGALITLTILNWDNIVSWFREHAEVIHDDANKIAFTLKEKMTTGECAFVQGIFNKTTDKVEEARHIKSEQVDEKVRSVHASNALVIYE